MAERTVKVNLVAQVSGYISGMDQAARKTRELGSESERLAQKSQAFQALGRGLLIFGAAAAAAVGLAVAKFAEFDKAMSNVQAVTQATTSDMGRLKDAALDAGGRTIFTATEAANAIEELGKAGFDTNTIITALDGTLALAASGQLEVARAAEITATTLKQFGLSGSEAGHVADVLSAGAGKALGSVEDLAQGLKFVGPVAHSMGISLEETTGALALFADQGIIGEQAGTSLRGVLASLTSPSAEAAKEIENLKINLYDANGGFIGLEGLAGKLGDAYQKMDDKTRDASLGLIFGNQQVTAARVLFQGGAKDIAKYTAEVNDTGYAARVAADRLDNLSGDVEKLGGAFDTALIKTGSGANEVLRSLVQSVTFLVDGIGDLPQPVLDASLAVATITAAVALAGGAAFLAVPKLAAFKVAMDDIGTSGKKVAIGVGLVGGAISAATLILSAFINEQAASSGRVDEFTASLDKATGATTKYTRELVVKKLQEKNAFDDAKKYGITQDELTDAVLNVGDAYETVQAKIAAYGDELTGNAKRAADAQASQSTTAVTLRTTRDELDASTSALENQTAATEDAGEAYQQAADDAAALQSQLDSLIDTINKANGVGQDAVTSNAAYQEALAKTAEYIANAQAGVEGYTIGFDRNTAAGAANQAMIAGQAKDLQAAAEAQLTLDGNVDNYISTLQAGQQALLDQAQALGASDEQLQFIAEHIAAIPDAKEVQLIIDKQQAQSTLDEFFTLNNGRVIYAHVEGSLQGGFASGGYTPNRATVTQVGEQGTEFVSTASTVARPENRAALEYMHRNGTIAGFGGGAGVAVTGGSSSIVNDNRVTNINEVSDPIGTAMALQRRQNQLAAA